MKANIVCCAFAAVLALTLSPAVAQDEGGPEGHVRTLPEPARPAPAAIKPANLHPFAALAGSWNGGGMMDMTNEIHEKIRCRANYNYGASNNSLSLSIRCASDNYKFELTSNVVERGGAISGTWSEAAYKVSGTINGRVSGGHITAVAKSDGLTANLSVNTQGSHQSVTITPEATYVIKVEIGLSKAGGGATTAAR